MITLVIPTYNGANYLKDSVQSVINQTYKDWECYIIDNASTDNTKDIAIHFCNIDQRIKYKYYSELVPIWDNFNRVLDLPLKDYLKYLAVDDYLHEGYLEESINCFLKFSSVNLISVRGLAVDNEKRIIGNFENKYAKRGLIVKEYSQRQCFRDMNNEMIQHPSFIILKAGPFLKYNIRFKPEINEMGWHLDWEWVLRLINYGDVFLINKFLVYIRTNPNQEGSRVHRQSLEIKEKVKIVNYIEKHKEEYLYIQKGDVFISKLSLTERAVRYIYKELQKFKLVRAFKYFSSITLLLRIILFFRIIIEIPYYVFKGLFMKILIILTKNR